MTEVFPFPPPSLPRPGEKSFNRPLHTAFTSFHPIHQGLQVFIHSTETGSLTRPRPRLVSVVTYRRFMAKESKRYWLTFDAKTVRRPIIHEMSRKFDLVFDVRSANVTPEMGLMALELTGESQDIDNARKWLVKQGIQVNPI